jgi:hypothetical protein
MAFSAGRTTQGFEFAYNLDNNAQGNPEFIKEYPSLPNVAFTKGDAVLLTTGCVDLSDSLNATSVLGVVEKTQAAVTYGAGLLPVRINPSAVYCVSVVGVNEETVSAATSAQQLQGVFEGVSSPGADDRPNGAYLVVYDGADKGSIYVVRDFTHTGIYWYVDRPHKMDTTSKIYWLGGAGGATPIGPGTEIDIVNGSPSTLDGDLDPAGGPFTVVDLSKKDALDGTIHVCISSAHHAFGRAIT